MKFIKIWSNTGELNFDSNDAVIDIIATSVLDAPLSKATAQPNNRWQSDGRLNFYSKKNDGTLNFGVESDLGNQPVVVDLVADNYASPALSVGALSSISSFSIETELSTSSTSHVDVISGLSGAGSYETPITGHDFVFDMNVDRGFPSAVASKFENGIRRLNSVYSPFKDNLTVTSNLSHPVFQAASLDVEVASTQFKLLDANNEIRVDINKALHLQHDLTDENNALSKAQQSIVFDIQKSIYLSPNDLHSDYFVPPRVSQSLHSNWQQMNDIFINAGSYFENGKPLKKEWLDSFEQAVVPFQNRPDEPDVVEPEPEIINAQLIFKQLWDSTGTLDFLPIELDALIIMNEVTVYHIADDGTKSPVNPINATLSFDIDSFVWSFSGQFQGADNLVWLTNRAIFEININGHQLLFTLREFSKANNFANDVYSFTCVTNSQWLGSPYATLHNGTIESEVSAWQLVESKFTSEGFALNRSLTPDWVLEQDSFSYLNQSAMALALQIAEASGAIIQPDKTQDVINIQPRYKSSPWNWNALTDDECDHVIDADYIDTQSSKDYTTIQYNSVLISGETHGVITQVVKEGTAGDVPASDVLSSLSQDHSVNTELGRNLIANSGEQEVLGISAPVLPPGSAFSLVLPGEIVRIRYPNSVVTGLCLSNSLPIQSITSITQSISLEVNNGYN